MSRIILRHFPLGMENSAIRLILQACKHSTSTIRPGYRFPLCRWHSFPNTKGYKHSDTYVYVDTYGRKVPYPLDQGAPGGEFLRADPHQATLALAGLKFIKPNGQTTSINEIKSIHQELYVWEGVLTSKFEFEGQSVEVVTICHPDSDQLSFKIYSLLFKDKKLGVQIYFPYASGKFGKDPADFNHAELHSSTIISNDGNKILF